MRFGPSGPRSEMRQALPAISDELESAAGVRLVARIGVATGEVLAARSATDQPLAAGEAVNAARRLEELAGPAEILIDEETHRLARSSRAGRARPGPNLAQRRADSGPPPRRGSPGRDRARFPPRLAARGPRPAAGDPVDRVRGLPQRQDLPSGDGARRGGRGQVAPRPGVRRRPRWPGRSAAGPLSALRRRHHLLATGRGREGHHRLAGARGTDGGGHCRAGSGGAEGRSDRRRAWPRRLGSVARRGAPARRSSGPRAGSSRP